MLKYTGSGFIPGIPARDLSTKEVEKFGGEAVLIASGCYSNKGARAEPKEKKTKKSTWLKR